MTINNLVILGPTATGKTSLSLKLSEYLDSEIINSDTSIFYKDLKIKIRNLTSETTENIKFSTLDIRNQKLRRILVQAQTYFEKKQDSEAIIECWKILRTMHSHRKISHLLSILQGK